MNASTSATPTALPNGHDRRNARHKRTAAPASSRDNAAESSSSRQGVWEDSRTEHLESIKRSTRYMTNTSTTTNTVTRHTSLTPDSARPSEAPTERDRRKPTSWQPDARLLPHTSAPLAGRISQPPLLSDAPLHLRSQPIEQLSLREQESAIIDDLLFALMGLEGQYCQYSASYRPSDEKSRLEGRQFSLVPGLDPSRASLTEQILTMASHYAAVESFMDVHSRDEFGVVSHALCAAMRKPLKDYLVLVAQLEHQKATDPDFSLHVMCLHLRPIAHTIDQLYGLTREIAKENAALNADDADNSDDDDIEAALALMREGPAVSLGTKICKGGALLRLITSRLQYSSGDPLARDLLASLLHDASKPYVAMLVEWLYRGAVRDPHQEFMIKEQKSIRREGLGQDYTDEYWEKRYTARDELVPPQLQGVKEKVLLAGKYLSIVRDDGGVDVAKMQIDTINMPQTIDDSRLVEMVNAAYASANSSLLTLLLTTHSLPAVFRSLKHYYFLDRSDFFSSFLHLADNELGKSAKNVNVHKLQSLLDIVLRQSGSVTADDPYKESVKVEISNITLWKWLMQIVSVKGLDADGGSLSSTPNPAAAVSTSTRSDDKDLNGFGALTLDFEVAFPLSLVVSRVTLTRYQVLFRYLLALRHLETSLVNSWKNQEKDQVWRRKSSDRRIEDWKRRAWCLRSRMLCFVQQLLYFCTAEVIEPNWQAFMVRLEAAERAEKEGSHDDNGAASSSSGSQAKGKWTVDELMQDHVDFLATCLKECMLTNSKLLNLNPKVITICTTFVSYTDTFTRYLDTATSADLSAPTRPSSNPTTSTAAAAAAGATTTNPSGSSTNTPTQATEKLFDSLKRFEDHFSKSLRHLLDALNYTAATETAVFINLCARLSMACDNINGPGTGSVGSWQD